MARLDEAKFNKLVNKYDGKLVESVLAGKSKRVTKIVKQLVENTKVMMNENSDMFIGSTSIAGFTPVLIPMVVRLVPQLFAMNLVGVQPMTQNTGKVFALRYEYQGNQSKDVTDSHDNLTNVANSLICILDKSGDSGTDDILNTPYTLVSTVITSPVHDVQLLPVHVEGNKALMKIVDWQAESLDAIMGDLNSSATVITFTQGGTTYTLAAAVKNDDIIKNIFTKYTGPMTPQYAEENFVKRSRLGLTMTSKVFEADVRELATEFSIYAYEDALANHNFDLQTDLISTASYLLAREIDGDIIDAIELAATKAGVRKFDFANVSGHTNEVTKIQTMVMAINQLGKEINKGNRAGRPNFLVVGSTVATLLESLPTNQFTPAVELSDTGEGFIGILSNRYNVYLDNYRNEDMVIIGYKGKSELDTGIVFAPYRPISVITGTGENDFRSKSMFNARYKIVDTLYGAENYYRVMLIKGADFLSTPVTP